MLVRRTVIVGLLTTWLLAAVAGPAQAALPVEVAPRDVSGPGVSGDPNAGAVLPTPGVSEAPIVAGKAPPHLTDVQRQGSVVAVFEDPADPLIVIAVENGYITVRLRCGNLCPSIHLGDYVVVEGQRRSEAVLDAVDVWVATP